MFPLVVSLFARPRPPDEGSSPFSCSNEKWGRGAGTREPGQRGPSSHAGNNSSKLVGTGRAAGRITSNGGASTHFAFCRSIFIRWGSRTASLPTALEA